MRTMIATDTNGVVIKRGDIVKIVKAPIAEHGWLTVGSTLRVAYWEDRSLGTVPYVCVFLESKKGRRLCSLGVQDNRLEVVKV